MVHTWQWDGELMNGVILVNVGDDITFPRVAASARPQRLVVRILALHVSMSQYGGDCLLNITSPDIVFLSKISISIIETKLIYTQHSGVSSKDIW